MRTRTAQHVTVALLTVFIASMCLVAIPVQVSADSSLTIIDYDYEGINPSTSQFFVVWVRGTSDYSMHINATVLEFVGSTGWPQLEISVYDYLDYSYESGTLVTCTNGESYTLGCDFDADGEKKFVVAVRNIDANDAAVYNITFSSESEIDFQYTGMFQLDDVSDAQSNTVSITYFADANPYLYRMENEGDSRIVFEWTPLDAEEDEIYFFLFNKNETVDIFVGLLGVPYYSDYPSLTAFIIDFESYDQEPIVHEVDMFTLSNYSVSATFTAEAGHRYNFWINIGVYQPDLYVVIDTFGKAPLDYEIDLFAENPEGKISIRPSFTDPWLEFKQLERDVSSYWLIGGAAAGIGGLAITVLYLRKRYY